jgi:hypothetical protein
MSINLEIDIKSNYNKIDLFFKYNKMNTIKNIFENIVDLDLYNKTIYTNEYVDVLELLLKYKYFNILFNDDALQHAVKVRNIKMIKILLKYNKNYNFDLKKVINIAKENKYEELEQLFIEYSST